MPKRYAIQINEESIDLVTFLNDGRRPEIKTGDKREVLIAWIQSPNEITTTIEKEDDLYENGYSKDGFLVWVII